MTEVYVASPYSHPSIEIRDFRIRAAQAYIAEMARCELHTFRYSPIAYYGPIANAYSLPHNVEFWHEQNLLAIKRCSKIELLSLPGWADSTGVTWELQEAFKLGIEVAHVTPTPTIKKLAHKLFGVECDLRGPTAFSLLGGSCNDCRGLTT